MTVSTHVLDTERGVPAAGVRVELWRGDELVGAGETDIDGRIRELAEGRAGHVPHRLPPADALLPPRRARGRSRRGPPSRPAAALVVRVHELPRQLTVEELVGLFEGRTRFVERLAELDDPLGQARAVAASLTDEEKKEVLDAHPAIGAAQLSARSAAEQGTDEAPELEELNRAYEARFGFRFVVFVNRRPKHELVPILRAPARAHARGGAVDGPRRARLDRRGSMASSLGSADYWWGWGDLVFRWLHVVAGIAWIGASFYFIALDNHLAPPAEERDAARGVAGEAWEIHGGGFYRVEKFRVAPEVLPDPLYWFKWEAYTTWLSGFALLVVVYFAHPSTLPDRRLGRRPDVLGGDRDRRRRPGARVARLRRSLPPARAGRAGARGRRLRLRRASPPGPRASSSRRAPRTSRSARCSAR